MVRTVVNYVIYRNNPYHQLLYGALSGRYEAVRGDVDDAIDRQRQAGPEAPQLFHIHWEEHALRPARTSAEAAAATDYILAAIDEFRALGGRLVWTVHNEAPHELEHLDVFRTMRRGLLSRADRICVHNLRSIEVLSRQGALAHERLHYLPHPSYAGVYAPTPTPTPTPSDDAHESAGREVSGLGSRTLLIFGMIRRYKGLARFLSAFRESGLAERGVMLHVAGEPLGDDDYADELRAAHQSDAGVKLDFRRVPDDEVARLFQESACLVLPYERFLSSGALLAALTCGAPVVGPNASPLREVLPPENQPFLYEEGVEGDIFRRIEALLALPPDARRVLRDAALTRATYLHPNRISRQLGALYDDLVGAAA